MRTKSNRSGFTILEILLVMAILIVIAAVTLPTLDASYGDTRVRGAGDDVRRACAEARSRAISTGVPYRFSTHSDNAHFLVAPDVDDSGNGNSNGASSADSAPTKEMDDGKLLVGTLHDSIDFGKTDATDSGGGWRTRAVFLPDGTCRADTQITIETKGGGTSLVVSIRQLTGIVSVQTKRQAEGGK
jgi:Tfp pilus assembly protein FimT